MSRISKLALVFAIAVLAIGARQIVSHPAQDLAFEASTPRAQVSPAELTQCAGVLPELKIDSYEWVHPLP
jgi:hypothetical protein